MARLLFGFAAGSSLKPSRRCLSAASRSERPVWRSSPLMSPRLGSCNPMAKHLNGVYEAVNEFESSDSPLLASPQGGVAERLRKLREASAYSEAGVVFR